MYMNNNNIHQMIKKQIDVFLRKHTLTDYK